MFKLLRTLTGLDLADTPLTAEEDDKDEQEEERPSPVNPRCRSEIRRWRHGSYTLVHDTDPEKAEYALDAMLFCGCEGWNSDQWGGFTSYLANEEDEELLSVHPLANSLALVYRDMDTLKFVKHVNYRSVNDSASSHTGQGFCDFHNVYYE
ncbi:Prolyl 3-hydroxylase OGFOD1 [Exaiptasia diaphana]|nr:Prolyl 3-hydroxylase OGFOD1 [Exaiptasia diaphana]